jgi:SAM-dependent methyltransferase
VGDVLDAPFRKGSFDAITCFNVFEHVYKPSEVLARVSEWLKPGGIFYMMVPNIDSAGARILRSYWYALELPRHLFHYSPATVKSLAHSAGLQEIYVKTHRELYLEPSLYYAVSDLLSKVGISRKPLSEADDAKIPWKVVRKALRLTIFPLITNAASLAGDGETISAIFLKDGSSF